jgi:acetyl esterase/lipase
MAQKLADGKALVYRTVNGTRLKLYVFNPAGHRPTDRRPAIVFFFGGGWLRGSAGQFVPQCQYFASRGMVAITADYRVFERQRALVVDCVSDAQEAMRYVRANAASLGIDPDRIAAGGGSAGGHLAAATAFLDDFTGDKGGQPSFRPNALVLFNPAVDLTPDESRQGDESSRHQNLRARLGAEPRALSPMDHIRAGAPPTIIFHGRSDELIPFSTIEAFAREMQKVGSRCEAVGFEGQKHGFFNNRKGGERYFRETLQLADRFLVSLGYLKPTGAAATAPAGDGKQP